MKYHEFKVRVPVLEGVRVRDWQTYIDSAVTSWYGGADCNELPEKAMYENDRAMGRIRVTRILPKPSTKLQHVPPPMTLEEQLFHVRNGAIALNDEEKRLLLEVARKISLPVPGVDDLLTLDERNALLKDENGG